MKRAQHRRQWRGKESDKDYETAMKRLLARKPRKIEWPGGKRPTREELYDRGRSAFE